MQLERQFSLGEAVKGLTSSSGKLSLVAFICMVLACVLPVVSISGSFMGMGGSVGLGWMGLAGALSWLVLLVFAAGAAACYISGLRPYMNLLDMASFGFLAISVVWAFTDGPVARGLGEMNSQMASLNGLMGGQTNAMANRMGLTQPSVSVSVLPSFGMLFLILAPVALFMARRKGMTTVPIVGTLLVMTAMPVQAASPQAVDTYLKRAHAGCTVNTKMFDQGSVRGAPAPVQLVELMIEGCPGMGNSWSAELVGVYEKGGRLVVASAPATFGIPETAAIVDGIILVDTLNYGPTDPRCCPTVKKKARLRFANGNLVVER